MEESVSKCGPEPEPAVRITLTQIYKELKHNNCVLRNDVAELKHNLHETRMNVHHLVTELERRTSEANAKVASLEAKVKDLDEKRVRALEDDRNKQLGAVATLASLLTLAGGWAIDRLTK